MSNILKCFYCNKEVELTELIEVDKILSKLNTDNYEHVMDHLDAPKDKPRIKPSIHYSKEVNFDVLNICKTHLKVLK